jgi:hypothetical protein
MLLQACFFIFFFPYSLYVHGMILRHSLSGHVSAVQQHRGRWRGVRDWQARDAGRRARTY